MRNRRKTKIRLRIRNFPKITKDLRARLKIMATRRDSDGAIRGMDGEGRKMIWKQWVVRGDASLAERSRRETIKKGV